ncbi:solute carrier family 35 member F5 [Patella vulgata]|uniref:solute carrier family 35 member F5 n=1 Tax=Patella vulgata TaxID=6465 RepID=UPI00217F26D4|nr:solute carrier family 35 member F5 [Patella vulgata]
MFGLGGLSRVQRLILGIIVLLIVDVIWVASSELTEYIFHKYQKPFFTTFVKTGMMSVYLLGFIIWKPWRLQCKHVQKYGINGEQGEVEEHLGEPIYVPVKYDKNSGTDSDDSSGRRSIRFNNLSEVRQLSEVHAEDAVISRLSYSASLKAEEDRLNALSKLSVKQVAKLGFIFSVIWFFANFAYQEALLDTEAAIVNVLSSTSGLFTLVCAAVYPSSSSDRFSLSKLVAVMFSIGGVVVVSISDLNFEDEIPVGALWALCGAILYALYLVSLRRKVDHEDKLDIPMFFGFVGLFCSLIMWPGFLILHYSKSEEFVWPTKSQWFFITVNGLVGTVFSEFLWLWGCFLTSSLIGTLALGLTIPLTMIADSVMKEVKYTWRFYLGAVPIFASFFAISFLTHYENWDPVLVAFKKLLHCICKKRLKPRLRELDREQTESLIIGGGSNGS